MISPNIRSKLSDRQQEALANYATRKGISKPTTKGVIDKVISELPEYEALEPQPEGNGD